MRGPNVYFETGAADSSHDYKNSKYCRFSYKGLKSTVIIAILRRRVVYPTGKVSLLVRQAARLPPVSVASTASFLQRRQGTHSVSCCAGVPHCTSAGAFPGTSGLRPPKRIPRGQAVHRAAWGLLTKRKISYAKGIVASHKTLNWCCKALLSG